jgi:alanyl-tRNA synthetase
MTNPKMVGAMDFGQIRTLFLDYFKTHGHEIVDSSSLIPRDDPTLLFTNAGMVQFKRLFLGEEKRGYTRAASSQKCVRAGGKHNDLDNVGYTARHHTFFEMLGNFSFGDYFKEEAICWAWELLTEGYRLPAERLYATVYSNDDEASRIWEEKIGLPPERIIRLGEKDNFWAMGDTGPCGPCSEILIDQGAVVGCGKPDCAPGCDCDRYLEIWNLVFTQFDRQPDGALIPLPRPNIDTGMGLERLCAVVQGVTSNYDTDLFKPYMAHIEELSGKRYGKDDRHDVAFRVIADHSRAVAFLIGDGIMPSNEGRGYVLRRIIRRAIRFGQVLGLEDVFLHLICGKVIDVMGKDYDGLVHSRSFIEGVVRNEEKRFADTLHYGMRVLNEEIEKIRERGENTLSGDVLFKLYDTFGLSTDIVGDVARDERLHLDLEGYKTAMDRQRGLSQSSWKGSGEEEIPEAFRRVMSRGVTSRFVGYNRVSAKARVTAMIRDGKETEVAPEGTSVEIVLDETPFYGEAGGQVGDSGWLMGEGVRIKVQDTLRFGAGLIVHGAQVESGTVCLGQEVEAQVDQERRNATALNHSATHLLHTVLREVLGDHVKQAGSLVAPDRLRFDFSHFAPVGQENLREVERQVNRLIRMNFAIKTTEMGREEAVRTGAMAIFEERYGDMVRLVKVGEGVSMELCGGTHTGRTGDIGLFRILSEVGVAANVRRIEALTGQTALAHDQRQEEILRQMASLLKSTPEAAADRLGRLIREQREMEKEVAALKAKLLTGKSEDLLAGMREVDGIKVMSRELEAASPKELRDFADRVKDKLKSGIILLGARNEGKAMLICVVTKDLTGRYKAGEIIAQLASIVGGRGGGRPDMAQGGGDSPEHLERALQKIYEMIEATRSE